MTIPPPRPSIRNCHNEDLEKPQQQKKCRKVLSLDLAGELLVQKPQINQRNRIICVKATSNWTIYMFINCNFSITKSYISK